MSEVSACTRVCPHVRLTCRLRTGASDHRMSPANASPVPLAHMPDFTRHKPSIDTSASAIRTGFRDSMTNSPVTTTSQPPATYAHSSFRPKPQPFSPTLPAKPMALPPQHPLLHNVNSTLATPASATTPPLVAYRTGDAWASTDVYR